MSEREARVVGLVGGADCHKARVAEAMRRLDLCSLAFADAMRVELKYAWWVDPQVLASRTMREVPLPSLTVARCKDAAFVRWAARHALDLRQPRSVRWVMQRWGTDFRRAQNPSYWLRVVETLLHRRLATGCRVVVADVRMPDEAAMLRRCGGVLLRVRGCAASRLADDTRRHISETQWPDIAVDGEIPSGGTPAELAQAVSQAVRLLPAPGPVLPETAS